MPWPQCAMDNSFAPGLCICLRSAPRLLKGRSGWLTRTMSVLPNEPMSLKLSDAYFAEARVSGATTRSGLAVASSVYPSGAAFNTFIAAMEPFARAGFDTATHTRSATRPWADPRATCQQEALL